MPGGIGDPMQGILAFTGIKFAGYSLAALYLNKSYPHDAKVNFLLVGLMRTLIGIVFAFILALVSFPFFHTGGSGFLIYLLGLIPVRLLEWFILIRIFYDEDVVDKRKLWKNLIAATIWSFVLDIPALLGLLLVGSFWIC